MTPQVPTSKRSEVMQYTRGPALFGIWVTFITLFISVVWGVLAPLDSAASADGMIVLESKKRLIQHREGGIIERIYVKNGDQVEKGEILIRLDRTATLANRDLYKAKTIILEAEHARLIAERDDLPQIKFKQELLLNAASPEISKAIQTQQKLFNARRETFLGKADVRRGKISQIESRLISSKVQLESLEKQISINNEQLASYSKLVTQGNLNKDRLREREQQEADLDSRKAQVIGQIDEYNDAIKQENLEIANDKTQVLGDIEAHLRQNQEQYSQALETLKQVEDQLNRLDILAPVSGAVNNVSNLISEGGSLPREQTIMEIVPSDDKLVLEARVKLEDIDVVRVGQEVSVRMAPFKSKIVPPLEGKIVSLSSDVIMPTYQGDQPHYKARIEFNTKSLNEVKNLKGAELLPGMQGSVMIKIGTRTFLQYILDPLTSSFSKAFIEQ